jgi:hypothetical protein
MAALSKSRQHPGIDRAEQQLREGRARAEKRCRQQCEGNTGITVKGAAEYRHFQF